MALQGTLDTFSLPDVLRLLATTAKTGRLRIDGDRGQGSVWLRDGSIVDADADRAVEGAPTDEVIFELLRFGSGSFAFDSDAQTPHGERSDQVEDLLPRANGLLSEWTELEAVVPSMDHRVSLSTELSTDEVTIDADRWRSVVAVGGGHTVGELGSALGLSELHVSRAVRDLVELGVAEVAEPGRIPDPGRLADLTDLSGELSRRSPSAPRSRGLTPPRGVPSLPAPSDRGSGEHVPSGRGSGEHVPSGRGSGEHVPSGRGSGEHVLGGRENGESLAEPYLAGEVPRAGWRQSERTTGPQQAVGPDGPPPSARSGNGQGRPPGPRPRPRRASADTPPPSAPSAASRPGSPNGGRGRERSGRGRPAPAAPPPASAVPPASRNGGDPSPPPRSGTTPAPLEGPSTGPGFSLPQGLSPEPSPLAPDEASPFRGTGLIPPTDPIHTGQIRAVSSSALPPEMHWAADDGPGTTGPITSPFAGLGSLGPARSVPGDGELAPHLAAMSPEARAAVQATVGPTGGSVGTRGPSTGDEVAHRGRLINFLSSVR